MDKGFYCGLFLSFALTIGVSRSAEQAADGYDALIQQGKSLLQAGGTEQAAVSGKAAIKMSADRWEGYALVGGALMNLKRYEAAADSLSEAIKRAPRSKQPALRDLRRQCLLAESGSPAPAIAPVPASTTTQAEVVLWKSIENSRDFADFESYLNQYPQGAFAVLAKRHLSETRDRAEAMNFVVQESNAQGQIDFTAYAHNARGKKWTTTFSRELRNASAQSCHLGYHVELTRNGEKEQHDTSINLRDVQYVVVKTMEEAITENNSRAGRPATSDRVDPPLFDVLVGRPGAVNEIDFREEELANRVAKALLHAVELCGGGNKTALDNAAEFDSPDGGRSRAMLSQQITPEAHD